LNGLGTDKDKLAAIEDLSETPITPSKERSFPDKGKPSFDVPLLSSLLRQ
jgi:hypothetical protein